MVISLMLASAGWIPGGLVHVCWPGNGWGVVWPCESFMG